MPELRRELSQVGEGEMLVRIARTISENPEIILHVDGLGERRMSPETAEWLADALIKAARGG